jgi:pyrroloquinoline quinone (PQQ) biosynthesis protein C
MFPTDLRARVEALYAAQTDELTAHPSFQALEAGTADRAAYDRFLANVVRAHLRSPKIVAFLFALAPPASTDDLLHNLLEELGVEEEDGTSHPQLLRGLIEGAGLAAELPALERLAEGDLRNLVMEPLMYGTLKEVGLAALVEVIAFEWMLSRTASRIARALAAHRGLPPATLAWFTHHSEVDVGHAEQGLDAVREYAAYYAMDPEDAATIAEMAMRENVFVRRYFGELALATASA